MLFLKLELKEDKVKNTPPKPATRVARGLGPLIMMQFFWSVTVIKVTKSITATRA